MIVPELQADGQIRVDMGAPFLEPASVPTTLSANEAGLPAGTLQVEGVSLPVAAVGMGNPHVVVPVSDLTSIPFEEWGASLEIDPAFPAKTNVHFLQVHSRSQLEIRVWERGAGPTLACGTGACATLVAAVLLGLSDSAATVVLPGGPLEISWAGSTESVFMTGPADAVFDGVINPELMPAGLMGSNDSVERQQEPVTVGASAEPVAKSVDDDCSEAEAQARVQAFLESTSLDSMINIATESLEQRTLSRFQRDGQT